jgi:hypothetical protein
MMGESSQKGRPGVACVSPNVSRTYLLCRNLLYAE